MFRFGKIFKKVTKKKIFEGFFPLDFQKILKKRKSEKMKNQKDCFKRHLPQYISAKFRNKWLENKKEEGN